jgi:hypothetical protein
LREQWRSVAPALFVGVLLFSGWQRRTAAARVSPGADAAVSATTRPTTGICVSEIETLKSPQRIERLATGALHLVTPENGAAIVSSAWCRLSAGGVEAGASRSGAMTEPFRLR